MTSLDRLLSPRSIAIVGLSTDPTKHGNRVLGNLRRLGFAGEVWGVNPKLPAIEDVEVFASLADLPNSPDVVVSALPAKLVPALARDAAAVDAAAMIVFAGGFGEAGEPGLRLEAELQAVVQETGIRILGPNSGGVISPGLGVAMSFLTCLDRPAAEIRSGSVGLVTQSGGMGSYVHNLAAARGTGLAASISTGNEADLSIADGIKLLTDLSEVRAIGVILETVRNGPAFIEAVRYAHNNHKRVAVVRIGRSELGQRLMRTHTGALAHPNRVLDGVLSSLGVPLTDTPEELLEVAEILALTPRLGGSRVGIVTHSGGVAIMLSDLALNTTIKLPAPGPALREKLEGFLQQGAANNPLDMGGIIGGPHRFAQVVDAFAESGEVDLVLAVSSAHPPAHTAGRVESLLELETAVPVIHLWMAGDVAREGLLRLRQNQTPVTEEPRAAIKAVAALVTPSWEAEPVELDEAAALRGPFNEYGAKQILKGWGLEVVEGEFATSADEAVAIAERLGYPVVVKLSSKSIDHKSDIGGVVLGVRDAESVKGAFLQVTNAGHATGQPTDGALVERQVAGPEIILGAIRDSTFGPMVLVGIGGIVAEALDDVQMALAPVALAHARRLIKSLAGVKLLSHPRTGTPADIDELAAMLVLLANHIAADSAIVAVDLNPVIWTGSNWLILDAVIET